VIDCHPATLAWLGGVHVHLVKALDVEHFGQTGTFKTYAAATASASTPFCMPRRRRLQEGPRAISVRCPENAVR
jgi:hypothetical protein